MKKYTTFAELQPGKTYIIQKSMIDDLMEVEVLRKLDNTMFVLINPETAKYYKWIEQSDEIYKILDEFNS